jgi:hypothetical protein
VAAPVKTMDQEHDILSLRSRIADMVRQEGDLVSQALQHSRGGDRQRVDELYVQLHALQLERSGLQRQIAAMLGTRRMHVASEVWRPGDYDYCLEVGGPAVRISVVQDQFGLHAVFPEREQPIAVETLKGTFDGPVTPAGSAPRSRVNGRAAPRSTPTRRVAQAAPATPASLNKPGA